MAEARKKAARTTPLKASPKKKAKAAKAPAKKTAPKAHSKATKKVAKKVSKKSAGKATKAVSKKKASKKAPAVPVAAAAANAVAPATSQAGPVAKPAPAPEAASAARKFALAAAQLVRDDKCTDVVLLDVRNLSQVTDYIVIGTGTSDRQMQSVLDHVEDLGKTFGYPAWKTDTDQRSTWLLLDCVDVVVHLFEPNTRAHYDLEMLWGDAPRIAWERPDQMSRDLAGLHA